MLTLEPFPFSFFRVSPLKVETFEAIGAGVLPSTHRIRGTLSSSSRLPFEQTLYIFDRSTMLRFFCGFLGS